MFEVGKKLDFIHVIGEVDGFLHDCSPLFVIILELIFTVIFGSITLFISIQIIKLFVMEKVCTR